MRVTGFDDGSIYGQYMSISWTVYNFLEYLGTEYPEYLGTVYNFLIGRNDFVYLGRSWHAPQGWLYRAFRIM